MKKLGKLLFFAAITALLTCLLCVALNAETVSGTCGAEGDGSNLTWTLDTETGVLKIEGKGAMMYYFSPAPWDKYRSNIKTAKIYDGVTNIGEWAFDGCSSLTSITIPDGVTSIGQRAFYGCSSLTSITIYSKTVKIYDGASTISNTATIYGYKGSTAEAYAEKYNHTFVPLECDEHNFGDAYKHDDINHWFECSVCHEKKDEAAHTFRQRFDKTHHWNECSCGFIKDKSEHTLDEEGKCTECRFGRVMLGDLNGDGKISAIDLTLMRKYIAGYKVDMIEAASDLNGDGRITAIDLTMLRKYIAGLITEF